MAIVRDHYSGGGDGQQLATMSKVWPADVRQVIVFSAKAR